MPAADVGDSIVLFRLLQHIASGESSPEVLMEKEKMQRNVLSQHIAFAHREKLLESVSPKEGDKRLRKYELNTKGFLKKFVKWASKRKNLTKEETHTIENSPVFQKRFEEFLKTSIQKIQVDTLHDAFVAFSSFFMTIEWDNHAARKTVEVVAQICFAGIEHPELKECYRELLQPNEK